MAFPYLLEKSIENGLCVGMFCFIYGVHNLTFGVGQYINNFGLCYGMIYGWIRSIIVFFQFNNQLALRIDGSINLVLAKKGNVVGIYLIR